MTISLQKLLFSSAFLILLSSTAVSGQNRTAPAVKPDPRLYDCFSRDEMDHLVANQRLLAYYNLYLDSAYFISKSSPEKSAPGMDIFKVKLKKNTDTDPDTYFSENPENFNPKTFNPLKYDFRIDPEKYTQYKLGNTGKVLVFYSQKRFAEKYNNYLKSMNLAPIQ